jgi:hypothetical protein
MYTMIIDYYTLLAIMVRIFIVEMAICVVVSITMLPGIIASLYNMECKKYQYFSLAYEVLGFIFYILVFYGLARRIYDYF